MSGGAVASTSSMSSGNIPVWVLFAQNKTELYREVRRVYAGQSDQLEAAWGVPGPFWARHYIFW